MLYKRDVATAVGQFLGVSERPQWFSAGSKVTADFQRDIGPVLGVLDYGPTKVRHMRAILESLAVPWSVARHSSEERANPGGNVTREAYKDLLEALYAERAEEAVAEQSSRRAEISNRQPATQRSRSTQCSTPNGC
ncbi:hypothetical protein GCM10009776_37220 [Microbacterium deminutum]|uniref:Uncharacterized protein n=1 Tax=Microbacterium deminutum TaxID=344164 RepID=A0ABN2RKQ8_9MICO